MKKLLLFISLTISFQLYAQSPGNALNFDGTNDMVVSNVPSLFSNLASNSFTFEAWVNPSASLFQRIIFAQPATNNFATFGTSTGNVIYFYVIAGGTTYSVATTSSIPQNQWTHVACRWTAATLTPQVFFNGVLQPTVAGGSSSTGTSGLLTLGTRPGGAQYFTGSLDEVRIWNVARTQCEIISNMNAEFTAVQPNLEVYYNFNQGIPAGPNAPFTTLPDINTNYDGTLNNFALSGATSNWIASGAVINSVGPNSITSSISNTICANDTLMFGGQPLTISGTYIDTTLNAAGCDSIITLNLTVLPANITNITTAACEQYSFDSMILTSSGMYYDTLPAFNGCDSIISLDLTINYTQDSSISIAACDQYNFNSTLLTSSGIYYDTLSTITGCDSIIELDLTINFANVTVNQAGNVLSSNAPGAVYQWLDCTNSFVVLPGETNDTLIATANGDYALMITENGCTDTSTCLTVFGFGIDPAITNSLKLYPNPSDGFVNMQIDPGVEIENIRLVNVNGELIQTLVISKDGSTIIDLTCYSAGIYFLQTFVNGKPGSYMIVRK